MLHLRTKPNARRNQLLPSPDAGTWTVRLHAPAQDGKANACLRAFLAEVFGVPTSSVILLHGHTSPFKKVESVGRTEADVQAVLAALAE